ncbi:hypothetical protein PG985_015027 [Apiospora marii]|uniref:uncharacterized protein n=1 Tax=Apiospora marii TaxID=335849 RepID=UPI003132235B
MESNMTELADAVQVMTLGEDAPKQPIQKLIQQCRQTSEAVTSMADSIQARFGGPDVPRPNLVTNGEGIQFLREGSRKLTGVIGTIQGILDELNEVTDCAIYERLRSLGTESEASVSGDTVKELMSWFGDDIKSIIRQVLDNDDHSNGVLWKVAEEGYKQATSPSGSLSIERYMVGPGEKSPFGDGQRGELAKDTCSKRWAEFWIRAIRNAPGGPTLFFPSAPMTLNATDIPPYLFRVSDTVSSGKSDAEVVASTMSRYNLKQDSRIDILSLEQDQATIKLHNHLTKPTISAKGDDNFMSWTSSLLFAIQYAIWRTQRIHSSGIQFCVVDTTKFPPGQFARDTWLLDSYRESASRLGYNISRLWKLRDGEDYYNGEYLSQGTLTHAGRSYLVSLKQLEEAGLYKLYREFEDPKGAAQWADRVKELRLLWSGHHTTIDKEISRALEVGSCISPSHASDMALMLLAFKYRERRTTLANVEELPRWATKPVERE